MHNVRRMYVFHCFENSTLAMSLLVDDITFVDFLQQVCTNGHVQIRLHKFEDQV
jgi:hypothetical protein